jgi:putative hydrolase of the HAD superfamily
MINISENIKALCFDYGNTLIPYGPEQVAHQYEKIKNALNEMFGWCDPERLKEIRDRQIVAPFKNGYKENDLRTISEELINEMYGIESSHDHLDALIQVRYEAFVRVGELSDDVLPLLQKLKTKYRLGFLSNYPCGRSVRDSMDRVGLSDMFEAIVVSGELGYAKPHPKPFETLLEELDLSPSECAFIGDNWLADVQGAKRMGMHAIHITQYIPYETFKPEKGDHPPDAVIQHIQELEELLYQ